jgi:biotin synthase
LNWKNTTIHNSLRSAQETILQGRGIPPETAPLLTTLPPERLPDLINLAATVMLTATAARFTCAIINAKSGNCSEDCAFCAQSTHPHAGPPTYPLLPDDELLRRAETAANKGVNYLGPAHRAPHRPAGTPG